MFHFRLIPSVEWTRGWKERHGDFTIAVFYPESPSDAFSSHVQAAESSPS